MDGQKDGNGWVEERGGCQGEMTEQQDENGPVWVCVCVSVGVETERERQTVKVCCHRRCSQLVTGITASVTASPIGQWASASDLIGSGSETDDLFLEMTGSCSAETHTSCDSSGPVPLSFCQCLIYVCVCVCMCACV